MSHTQTDMTAADERAAVVAWLRGLHWTHTHYKAAQFFADAIEAANTRRRTMVSELEPCQLCGALPCDWVNDPHKTPTPDAGGLVDEYDIAAAVTNLAANVLKASGSNLKHYTMPSSKKAILSASMDGIEEAYRAGAEFVGSKYRATITAQAAEIARLRGLLAEVAAQPTITEMARGPDKPRIMMTIKERLDGMVRNKERHDAIIMKARALTGETP